MGSSLMIAVGLLVSGYGPPQAWEFNPPLPPGARIIGPARVVQPNVQAEPSPPPAPPRSFAQPAPLGPSESGEAAPSTAPEVSPEPAGGRSTLPSVIPDPDCEDCGDGGSGGGGNPVNCVPTLLNPGKVCHEGTECTDIAPPAIHGKLRRIPGGSVDACRAKTKHTGTIKTPAEVCYSVDSIQIARHRYKTDCCDYEVCIPVKTCCIETVKCEIRDYENANLEVCLRSDNGLYDVYVYGIDGMPNGWVYLHNATKAQVNAIPRFSPQL